VISQKPYNEKAGLGIFCPITSKGKGCPFEVKADGNEMNGVILSDQAISLDWKAREIEFLEKATDEAIERVIEIIKVIIE
jgi:mRNA interferase MazF